MIDTRVFVIKEILLQQECVKLLRRDRSHFSGVVSRRGAAATHCTIATLASPFALRHETGVQHMLQFRLVFLDSRGSLAADLTQMHTAFQLAKFHPFR